MARAEVTGKKISRLTLPTSERDAFSILEFCARNSISRSTYYNLKRLGQGPHETRVMRRIVITAASAAAWLKRQEKQSA
jgi:hypothetical protein